MGPKCDCVCELVEDSQASSKSVSDGEEDERRHARVLEGTKENKRVDWRVLEHDSGIAEEDIGMIRRDNEVCYSGMDFSKACGIQRDDQQILSKKTHVGSTTSSGPKDRAKLSDVIEIGGHQRKGEGSDSLVCKMRAMKGVLKVWNRNSYGNVDDNYRKLVDELEQLDTK
ncbi:hypothetical protein V6N12_065517 [Hibiscus sabdariffa]|uniref:Uncharacterized protein n=1 Tax=Hibiscus sabdariffa TaxID=183260 RepID=A0ABR2G8Y7_9ROSI